MVQWQARCAGDPVKATKAGSSPSGDRAKDRFSSVRSTNSFLTLYLNFLLSVIAALVFLFVCCCFFSHGGSRRSCPGRCPDSSSGTMLPFAVSERP